MVQSPSLPCTLSASGSAEEKTPEAGQLFHHEMLWQHHKLKTIQSQYRYHDSISRNDILNGLEWAVVQPNLTRFLHWNTSLLREHRILIFPAILINETNIIIKWRYHKELKLRERGVKIGYMVFHLISRKVGKSIDHAITELTKV